jgi:hypothetical protein
MHISKVSGALVMALETKRKLTAHSQQSIENLPLSNPSNEGYAVRKYIAFPRSEKYYLEEPENM